MGQYWIVVNLDKWQWAGDGGKLGEWIFDTNSWLISLLNTPRFDIPPAPQEFEYFCEREGRRRDFHQDLLAESHREGHLEDCQRQRDADVRGKQKASEKLHYLDKLPDEILQMIFQQFTHWFELVPLMISCRRCWDVARPVIARHWNEVCKSQNWAGDRIICIGDYADDLPDGLLNAGEMEALRDLPTEEERPAAPHEDSRRFRLYNTALANFISARNAPSLAKQLDGLPPSKALNYSEWCGFGELACVDTRIVVPKDEVMVIRNLTKRVYVRQDALNDLRAQENEHVPYKRLGLAHVILIRICWSSDPSAAMAYAGNIHRGVWAGDRFDMSTLGNVEEETANETEAVGSRTWMDVSEEIVAELKALWDSEYS